MAIAYAIVRLVILVPLGYVCTLPLGNLVPLGNLECTGPLGNLVPLGLPLGNLVPLGFSFITRL